MMQVLSLVLLFTMLFCGLLSAQQKRERFEIAIYAGAGMKGSEHRFFDEINHSYGFGFTYRLNKRFGIEAELSYLPFSAGVDLAKFGGYRRADEVSGHRLLLDINGLIYILEGPKVKPFITVGFGWLDDFSLITLGRWPTDDFDLIEYRKNDLQFPNIGIGVSYLSKNKGFFRVKLMFHQPGSKELQTTRLVAGFGFRF